MKPFTRQALGQLRRYAVLTTIYLVLALYGAGTMAVAAWSGWDWNSLVLGAAVALGAAYGLVVVARKPSG